jgi:hypothetical protein
LAKLILWKKKVEATWSVSALSNTQANMGRVLELDSNTKRRTPAQTASALAGLKM